MGIAAAVASTHRQTRRTILSQSPELQLVFRLIAAIGVENVFAAEALVVAQFRFEAAVNLLQQWLCEKCGWQSPMRASPADEKPLWSESAMTSRCPRCKATLDH